MSYDAPTLSAIAASVSDFFSFISALLAWRNTNSFYRQLTNSTLDACLAAAVALKAAVHKTIEHKANKEDKITSERIQKAYDDTWPKWVAFHQAFRIAQRYNEGLKDKEFDAPDKTSDLLSQLRISLRDESWTPSWTPRKPNDDAKDIRPEVDKIVDELQTRMGLAEG
jgi:hypothetical protein